MKSACFILCLSLQCAFATPNSEALYSEAQRIVSTFKESVYDHRNVANESTQSYRFNCSGFVGYVLKKIHQKEALNDIPIDRGHTRARAQNFYDYFQALKPDNPRWEAVLDVSKLERGDIIAWKFDASLGKLDTGHVVIVAQKPEMEAPQIYRVRVIDSTTARHDNDSRMAGYDGLGMGNMRFRVNETGGITGIFWSTITKKESHHLVAMGRIK